MKLSRVSSEPSPEPWKSLRGSGELHAEPEESVLEAQAFDASYHTHSLRGGATKLATSRGGEPQTGWSVVRRGRNELLAYPEPMADADIRWRQRFDNFERALQVLARGVALAQQRPLSELEQQGLIQGFEFTHELAWKSTMVRAGWR